MATEWLYGRNAVLESLRAGRRKPRRLQVAETSRDDERLNEINDLARDTGCRVDLVQRAELDERIDANHQGVALETSGYPYVSGADLTESSNEVAICLALDEVEDPRNVGSLLRTAEAVGVEMVVLPEHRSASITPAVVNASAGAVEHLRIARETNLARWLRRARDAGYWLVGLEDDASAENLFDCDVPVPAVLIVGSEGRGLRRLTRESCDLLVSIPMYGRVGSLNVAVAGSIALYEIREYATGS